MSLTELPHYFDTNGSLVVIEAGVNVHFDVLRLFIVKAPKGEVRGEHAHKQCNQFLICPSGSVTVVCDDGKEKVTFILDNPNLGLLIPPSIWATQTYDTENAVLTVLCDHLYDASDYIRDYAEFINFRNPS